jgi:hypothetical protein
MAGKPEGNIMPFITFFGGFVCGDGLHFPASL